jgi:hypothetical protein
LLFRLRWGLPPTRVVAHVCLTTEHLTTEYLTTEYLTGGR